MSKIETTKLNIELRVPTDLFLIKESAALAVNAGLPEESMFVEAEDQSVLKESDIKDVVVSGTPRQIAVFEEILTCSDRASRKIGDATGTSQTAYEAAMRDHFRLLGVRLGLQQAS
jgi:hypothetical protein